MNYDELVKHDDQWHDHCPACNRRKPWYSFKIPFKKGKAGVCLKCKDRLIKGRLFLKLYNLERMASKNKMSGLRDHLFETIEGLRANAISPEKAKSICEVAQVIINSAKVELEFIKIVGAKKSDFLQIENQGENVEPERQT
jgi:hypothetical protein